VTVLRGKLRIGSKIDIVATNVEAEAVLVDYGNFLVHLYLQHLEETSNSIALDLVLHQRKLGSTT